MKRTIILSAAIAVTALSGAARQPERGYRGFVDWSNRITHQTVNYASKTYYIPGIATSHGYQINPWLFVGGGIDFSLEDIGYSGHHSYDLSSHKIALFAEGRTDLQFGKFTPFADIRLGWNAQDYGTVYFSPSIGYRFNWGRKVGINLGIGYTLDAFRVEKWIPGYTQGGYLTYFPTGEYYNWNQSSFTFRVGIDF